MRIVMVKGFSGSGKTATVTSLVQELVRRGYSVGTVKDIHYEGYEADDPGTDTYKHRKAGAYRVTARGQNDTAIIIDGPSPIEAILKYYKEDFVILEGDCGIKCPTVITGKTREDIDKRMCDEAVAVSGIYAANEHEYGDLPVINGITEVEKMADLVEKKTKEAEEKNDVELTVGGEEIAMVPFVKKTLKNVVVGAVSALDGYEEGREIVIRIK